jgi:ATP-dependent helicase/nuclease subunit A
MGGRVKALPDAAARATALTAIDRSLLVEAGAGSGKTALMAGRVAVLFANGVEPKHVAAVLRMNAPQGRLFAVSTRQN